MYQRYLNVTVFAAGMTTLAIELSASRLLGNVFGTSNIVWANIIGLILVYLAAGYFIGGRWADRSPYADTFYRLIAWGAFTAGLIPIIARPVLLNAARAVERLDSAVMIGSFIVILILFSLPVTLLGCVSPFAIRICNFNARFNTRHFSPCLAADPLDWNCSNLPRLQLGTPGCGFNWTWHGELAISSQTNMDADPSTYLSCVHLAWTRERHHRVNLRKGIGL